MSGPIDRTALRYALLTGLLILTFDLLSDILVPERRWFAALHGALAVITVVALYVLLHRELQSRERAERALRQAHEELETRVEARTAELSQVNLALQAEIAVRMAAEKEREWLLGQVAQDRASIEELAGMLATERDRLEAIMENTRTCLAYLDPQFNFVGVNRAYAQQSGHSEAELLGHNHFDLFPNLENQAIFERVRETGRLVEFHAKPFEYVDQPERGVTYWDWTLAPVRDGDGQVQGLVLSLLDVTQRIRAEEDLRQALEESRQRQAEISALLAGARSVLQHREFEGAASAIFDACKRLLGASAGHIALLTKDGDSVEAVFVDPGGLSYRVDPTTPIPFPSLRQGADRFCQTVYENDFAGSEWADILPAGHEGIENLLFAPLVIDRVTVGLLGLANKPGGFTENDARMASAFAELAAIALLNIRTLESLENSEERFRSVAQTASEAIITVDGQGAIVFWNQAAQKMFGYPANEIIGQSFTRIMPPPYRAMIAGVIELAFSTGSSDKIGRMVEAAGLRKDGSEFPIEHSFATWKTREGSFFTGVIHDITGRKQAEEALRRAHDELEVRVEERTSQLARANLDLQAEIAERKRAEESLHLERNRLKSILDAMEDGVCIINPQFEIDYINPVGEQAFGQVAGRKCYEYFHDRTAVCPWCPNEEVFAGKSVQWEWHSARTGKTYDLFDTPLTNADGSVSKLEILHDVTRRKRMEEDLKSSEEQFRQLAENIRETFWITDAGQGQVLYVSSTYEEIWGRSCQSLYEQPDSLLDAVHREDRAQVIAGLKNQVRGDYDEQYRIVRPGGEVRWIRTRAFPIRNEAGEVYRIAGISEDVTERVLAFQILEQRVEERTRELSTLLDVSRSMASTLDMEPLLGLILDQLKAVVDCSGVTIYKLEDWNLIPLAHRGPIPQEEAMAVHFSVGDLPIPQEAILSQTPVIISDVLEDDTPLAGMFRQAVGKRLETTFSYIRSWMGVPMMVQDRVIGMLGLHYSQPHYYTAEHAALATAFASQAAMALENARLYEQARELAALQERQRLARELHDSVSQTLFSASLSAEVFPRLWARNPDEGQLCLEELHRLSRGALAEMRALLLELRPAALIETELGDLLDQLAQAVTSRARVPVSLSVEGHGRLPDEVQVALYRMAQEALNNVVKHAEASQVTVQLRHFRPPAVPGGERGGIEGVELRIRDDGQGFNPKAVSPQHLGLGIMRERAEAIGAALKIQSKKGRGTHIVVVWTGRAGKKGRRAKDEPAPPSSPVTRPSSN